MNSKPPYDWGKFWVHFACGAVLGVFVGCRAWARSSHALSGSMWPGVLFMAGGAVLVRLLAGAMSNTGWDQ